MDRKKVLVIYGKDQKLTGDIFRFLHKIGLRPVELHNHSQRGASNPHEVLQAAINAACAILILLTGDDEAKLKHRWYIPNDDGEDELYPSPQPRLNVLFEAGVAFATRPNNTILIKRGRVRLCSHLADRRCVELDDTYEQRFALIKMLQSVGCTIDLSSHEWVDIGDFSDPDIKDNMT